MPPEPAVQEGPHPRTPDRGAVLEEQVPLVGGQAESREHAGRVRLAEPRELRRRARGSAPRCSRSPTGRARSATARLRAASSIVARSVGVRSQFIAAPREVDRAPEARRAGGGQERHGAAERAADHPDPVGGDLGTGARATRWRRPRPPPRGRGARPARDRTPACRTRPSPPGRQVEPAELPVAAAVREQHRVAPRRQHGRGARPAEVARAGLDRAPVVQDQAGKGTGAGGR